MARIYEVTYKHITGRTKTVKTTANTRRSAQRFGRWKLPKKGRAEWWATETRFVGQTAHTVINP